MSNIRFGRIEYNAARQSYQARVDVQRAGRTFRYPCEVTGPLNMDQGLVRHALAAQALGMSDSPGLHSVK